MRNLLLMNAVLMASTTEGGDANGSIRTDMVEVHGKTLEGKDIKEGTLIPKAMIEQATTMLGAFWEIEDRRRGASQMVLNLAMQAVRCAEGDYKLALGYFENGVNQAVNDFRSAHVERVKAIADKKAQAEEKAKIEEFLNSQSSWFQYVSNIRGAMQEGFLIHKETGKTVDKWQLKYPTEHSLRVARQTAKQLKNHSRAAVQKLADTLDTSDLNKEEIAEAQANAIARAPKNATEQQIKELVKDELLKAGAAELDEDEVSEKLDGKVKEADDTRLHSLSEQWATTVVGDEPAYTRGREALAKLIRQCASVDMDTHTDELAQILDNASTKISALIIKANEALATPATLGKQVVNGPQVVAGL